MKKLLIIFIFFIFNINVYAKETYLTDLSVEGINISPTFDKYNNVYTGLVTDDFFLNIKYTSLNEDDIVTITGDTSLLNEENVINILVKNEDDVQNYQLILTKDKSEELVFYENETQDNKYNMKLVFTILLIINILLYLTYGIIIFKKHKV